MTRTSRALSWACAAAVTVPLAVAPAAAQPIEKEKFVIDEHFEFDCEGVLFEGHASGRGTVMFVRRGPSGLPHFQGNIHESIVFTNTETGLTYTRVRNVNDRDFRVVDNGDDTLTLIVQLAGMNHWYDADGKLLFIDSGTELFELVVDNNGTPDDPFDDGEAEFVQQLRDLTGRMDTWDRDFCADAIEVTT